MSKTITSPADNTITINIDSDELETAIYPRITIQHGISLMVNVDRKMVTDNKWVDDDWMDGTVYYYASAGEYYYNKHNEDGSVVPTSQTTMPTIATTSVIIKNTYVDDRGETQVATLRIANNSRGEKVVLDGANRVVSSSSTNRIFGDDFVGWSWLPMYNGTNTITVIGNCTVTLEYRTVVKCGEL